MRQALNLFRERETAGVRWRRAGYDRILFCEVPRSLSLSLSLSFSKESMRERERKMTPGATFDVPFFRLRLEKKTPIQAGLGGSFVRRLDARDTKRERSLPQIDTFF